MWLLLLGIVLDCVDIIRNFIVWILLRIVLNCIVERLLCFWFLKISIHCFLDTIIFLTQERETRVDNADSDRNILIIKYYVIFVVGNLK